LSVFDKKVPVPYNYHMMTDNIIELPGVKNVRELGGYRAGDRTVKKDLLIRGGSLSNAGPDAINILVDKYHVQAIVDLRMTHQFDGTPDPDVPGAEMFRFPVVEIEDYLAKVDKPEIVQQFMSGGLDKKAFFEAAYGYGFFSPGIYDLFLLGSRGMHAFRGFFSVLIDCAPDKGAIFWHCVGGKDRAGLASMLLLTALGADKDVILEDYLLTNVCNAVKIEQTRKYCEAAGMPPEMADARVFVASCVYGRYMTHAMGTLEKQFGSVEGYLYDGLGLTEEDISILRGKYTE